MSDWKNRFKKFLKSPAKEPEAAPPAPIPAPPPDAPLLAPDKGPKPDARPPSFPAWESIVLPKDCPCGNLTEPVQFVHPFSGEESGFHFPSIADALDRLQKPGQDFEAPTPAIARWIQWRIGPHACALMAGEPAIASEARVYWPADARRRDTTIWHRQLSDRAWTAATAPEGRGQAALLWMQVDWAEEWSGRAADWRDVWSGRLLHSWLMAHVLQAVTEAGGLESVVYPWLPGQPLYDRLNQVQLKAAQIKSAGGKPLWEIWGLGEEPDPWLASSLPTVCLALVPSQFDVRSITSVLDGSNPKSAWRQVSDACWEHLKQQGRVASGQRRAWDYQTSHAWRVGWEVWPWKPEADILESLDRIRDVSASQFTLARQVAEAVVSPGKAVADLPAGWTWAAQLRLLQHHFRARRVTCDFAPVPSASSGDKNEPSHPEDLSAVSRIREVWLETEAMRSHFPGQDLQAASLRYSRLPACATERSPARGASSSGVLDPSGDTLPFPTERCAILAVEVDQPWLAGEKVPAIKQVLAGSAINYFERQVPGGVEWLNLPRPLSLALQRQFSEALSHFGLYAVPRIVAAHGGAVLESSGCRVLAVVPVSQALDCLHGLRLAFQGSTDLPAVYPEQFAPTARGFILLAESHRRAAEPSWSLLVPGPTATISARLAIGSGREPVDALLRAAQTPGCANRHSRGDELTVCWMLDGLLEWEWNAPMNSPAVQAIQLLTGGSVAGHPDEEPALGTEFLRKLHQRLGAYFVVGSSASGALESFNSETRAMVEAEINWLVRSAAGAGAGLARLRKGLSDYLRELERMNSSPLDFLNWLRLAIRMRQTKG